MAFAINYRAEPPAPFPAAITDTVDAIRWIIRHAPRYAVDPKRLAVFGDSAGGNLAALVATNSSAGANGTSLVRAGVAWSGLFDLTALANQAPSWAGLTKLYLGCGPAACPDRYRTASPSNFVRPTAAPLFLANSTSEIVPIGQLQELSDKLRAAGVPNEIDVLPGTAHGLAYFPLAWPQTIAFLDRYLFEPKSAGLKQRPTG